MKHIEKNEPPEAFESWKERKHCTRAELENIEDFNQVKGGISKTVRVWRPFTSNREAYTAVKIALALEQGNICCYCQNRLAPGNIQIEHLRPRSTHPVEMFDYVDNMIASCLGNERQPRPREIHCGANKSNNILAVHPLQEDCHTKFHYQTNGKVNSTGVESEETKITLNLDCPKLVNQRKDVIEGYLGEDLEILLEGVEELEKLKNALKNRNDNDEFEPFCQVIINILS